MASAAKEIGKKAQAGKDQGKITKWMHLWNAANSLIGAAPTISRHLGHKLATEGQHAMTSFSRGLLCEDCGAIRHSSSRVRVRRRRRAVRGRCNKVVIACTHCGNIKREDGSQVREQMPKAGADGKVKKVRKQRAKINKAPTEQMCKDEKSGDGRRRTLKGSSNKDRPSKAANSGDGTRKLASSFLFKDLEL